MKKLMFAAVAIAAGVAVADVSSANVVGYQTVTIPAQQWTMLGVNFSAIGGEAISVQDVFPDPVKQGFAWAGAISGANSADQLGFWELGEGVGNYIYLYLNGGTQAARTNKWCVQTAAGKLSAAMKTKYGANNTASVRKIQPGEGFWVKRGDGKYAEPLTVQMSGQVVVAKEGLEIPVKGDGGWTMFNTGFTTDFEPNPDLVHDDPSLKVDWVERGCIGAGAISGANSSDQLGFWELGEGVGNYIYLYLNTNQTGRKGYWCVQTAAGKLSAAMKAKYGANNTATHVVVPAGQAVWFKGGAGSADRIIKIPQPYTLD